MPFDAIATDYDGTIAFEGHVDAATLTALQGARRARRRLVLVTGRELTDLSNTFPHLAVFDRVVAENGALLHNPTTKTVRVLGPPPPPALIDWLTARKVPLSVGHSIVATVESHQHAALEAIHELALDWHIVLNKGSVMLLPANVTKATGLKAAIADLGVAAARTIGIGDAENDVPFLRACGLAVAVANALDSVKAAADVVTIGARGAGVVECIDRWRRGEFDGIVGREAMDQV
jgi:hydroxymethylpyrimidine pyrophosphatase-like HAD family hydrolase